MTLVFAVMHLYNVSVFNCLCPFFFLILFKTLGIDKTTEWSTVQTCPSLTCAFLTGAITKELILRKISVLCLYMYVYITLCQD